MSLLVTGGHGFVMSNLVRKWLEQHPRERVIILDRDAPDAAAQTFFSGLEDRIVRIRSDIIDRAAWHAEAREHGIDRIAHGAALTPHPWTGDDGIEHDPEREWPERTLDVNLGGTLAVLAFARSLPVCSRLLIVSTGSVYGDDGPNDRALPELGYVEPESLYGISKYAAELVARRFGDLFGLPVVAARLAAVYGPMDRVLPSRQVVCPPNRMTALALARRPIRLNSADGVGDWISVSDVVTALVTLLEAERPRHPVYNVASGRAETLARLAELTTALVPGATWSIDPDNPNVCVDPRRRRGQWGAYDIGRMRNEFGWEPAPLERGLADYIDWRQNQETKEYPL